MKVIQMGLATMVVPLGGWVWNMNVEVAKPRNDLGDAEVVIQNLVKKKDQYESKEIELASQIIGIEKDIEYMMGSWGVEDENGNKEKRLMTTGFFVLLFSKIKVAQQCDDLKRDMKALELFLQDQEDKEKVCPKLEWEQPDISVYKKELE